MKKNIYATLFIIFIYCPFSYAASIIIDHTCTDISTIPAIWIQKAKNDLRIAYSHTSHGSQLVTGIESFREASGSLFYYSYTGWGHDPGVFLNDYWANDYASDLGYNGDTDWFNATRTMLGNSANDRNVVIWSWCGGVSDNTAEGIDAYLNAMNLLEQSYPSVTFVYMTGHLDGSGSNGTLHLMNQRIRDYCKSNNKILFDFADIERYDPDGNDYLSLMANDNCDYDSDGDGATDKNWATEWMAANPSHEIATLASTCEDCCAHSQQLNCVMKGRAFWWLMARIAGWDPSNTSNDLPTSLTQIQVSQLYVSIFGRASEGEGNAYWCSNQNDMVIAADTMLDTEPAKAYFGSTLNDYQAFIEFIYINTLGKTYAEDPTGINYWVNQLSAGKSKGEVIATMISAAIDPQYAGSAAQNQFNNKVEVCSYTAGKIATCPNTNDLSAFVNFIKDVTHDSSTVTAAKATVDAF